MAYDDHDTGGSSWEEKKVEIAKQGWVQKKGEGFLDGWKKRYIKLSTNKSIEYYTDSSFKTIKGSVNLDNISSTDIKASDKVKDNEFQFGFCIKEKKRVWLFCVNKKSELDSWIQTIKDVIDDNYFKKQQQKIDNEKRKLELKTMNKYGGGSFNSSSQGRGLKNKYKKKYGNSEMNGNINGDNDGAWGGGWNENDANLSQQQKMEQIQQRSNAALDNALKTTIQTEDIAVDTAVKLDGQRQQLLKIDKDLHETDQMLDQTNDTLKGMKSIGGAILKKFRKPVKKKEYVAPVQKKSAIMRKDDTGGGKIVVESNGQTYQAQQVEQTEEDQKLDDILKGLKRIQAVTVDINKELKEQDVILDSIDNKMTDVQGKIYSQTKTINGIK